MNQLEGLGQSVFAFIVTRCFADGIELYFIIPTAWYYIKSLGQNEKYLAIVLVSFNMTSLIMTPLIARIADRFGCVKMLIIITAIFRVLGNLIYSINDAVFPLIGRILCGIAQSCSGLFFRQVALYAPDKKRACMFIILDGAYCLGPMMGSFITFNANILGWKINAGNSPGIILTCFSLIFLAWSIFLPNKFGVNSGRDKAKTSSFIEDRAVTGDIHRQTFSQCKDFNSKVLCLLYIVFCSEVFSSTVDFSTPLLAQEILHLPLIHVKLYFLNSSLMTFGLFLTTYISSSYFSERKMVVFFLMLQLVALSLLTSLVCAWYQSSFIYNFILLLYVTLGSQFLLISLGCSLLSKVTDSRNA